MVFACQVRSVPWAVRKGEPGAADRLAPERGILSAAMAVEQLWNRTLAAFGSTRTARSSRQARDMDRERGSAGGVLFTDEIWQAKAAPATSAHGILLEAAKRALLLIPMPAGFGSTKKIRRNPDRTRVASAVERVREPI